MKYIKVILILFLLVVVHSIRSQEIRELAIGQADAVVNLKTREGVGLIHGEWRNTSAQIETVAFRKPGPSDSDPLWLYPTGDVNSTFQIRPKMGDPEFENRVWEKLDPDALEIRKGSGLLSFTWYRFEMTLPAQVDGFPVEHSTVMFEIVVDDYSEIWVNGKQRKTTGQSGSGVISGWNTRNRVLLTADAMAGDHFDIAILGMNGPVGDLPSNYIWIRSATLDFYRSYPSNPAWDQVGQLEVFDDQLAQVLDIDAFKVTKLADGFQFTEGPVWHPEGYLLFSDPNANVIYRYDPDLRNVYVYMTKTGYAGTDIGRYHQPGSNGLAIDPEGRLIVCQHGNRRIVRHERKGPVTVLSDAYDHLRLNSPNDLVLKSDNSIYFTDPPYGLPDNYKDAGKELAHQGVYRIQDGQTELLTTSLGGPNGLAFSPDEKYLYVGNWDIRDIKSTKTVWRFPVRPNGALGQGEIFHDFHATPEDEGIDGIKVDQAGNLFVSAPGGLWIINAQGKLLGKITCPERPANMAWGDDGHTLYLTAHTSLYKMRVRTGIKIQA